MGDRIMSIRKLTNANFPSVEGVYDEGSSLYYPNYYDDSSLFSITGWDSSTALTKVELPSFRDGQILFFRDATEIDADFYWVAYENGTSFTAQEVIDLKKYIQKVPLLTYDDVLILGQTDLNTLSGGDYYYDANVLAYRNEIFETPFTYRMEFTPDDFGIKNFSIPYTDPDTGKNSVNLSVDIEYKEVAKPWEMVATVAFDFDNATTPMPNYINQLDGQTLTPTVGPIYSDPAVPVGQSDIFDTHMKILNGEPGNITKDTGVHLAYPYGQKPHGVRCLNNWDNSGDENYFDLHGTWSFEFAVCDQVSESDWALIGEQKQRTEQYIYVENSTNGGVPILDVQAFITNSFFQSTPKILIDGTEITLPDFGTNGYKNKKIIMCYEYDSNLDRGDYSITTIDKESNGRTTSADFLASPPNISCDTDIKLGGGWTGSAYEASYGKGIYSFVYYNNCAIDIDVDLWVTQKSQYYQTALMHGDSWTRGQNVDPDTEGYSNRFLLNAVNEGYKYFGVVTHYAPDYNDTTPISVPDPSWDDGNVDRPTSGSIAEFDRIVDEYIFPDTVSLAYTGINYGLKLSVNKPGNPLWDNVPWSTPVYFAQWHASVCDDRNIPFVTWDSAPTDLLMDRAPSETDMIDRAEDAAWGWEHFFPTQTLQMYAVSVDPISAGYIDPLKNLGDDAHVNEDPGYLDIGDSLWAQAKAVLVPGYTP
jgi:hypothetical protein